MYWSATACSGSAAIWRCKIFGLDVIQPLLFAQPRDTFQFLHRKGRTQFARQTLPASGATKTDVDCFALEQMAGNGGIIIKEFSFHGA